MLPALLLLIASIDAGPSVPAADPTPVETCAPAQGWRDGRGGLATRATCVDVAAYGEAHRLGDAMRLLETERAAITLELPTLDAPSRATRLRRQRQIDTDLEALRGVATIRSWPIESPEEPTR